MVKTKKLKAKLAKPLKEKTRVKPSPPTQTSIESEQPTKALVPTNNAGELIDPNRKFDVQVNMPLTIDQLVAVPMRKFKDICAAKLKEIAERHTEAVAGRDKLIKKIDEKLKEAAPQFAQDVLDAFRAASKLIDGRASLELESSAYDKDKPKIVIDFIYKLKLDTDEVKHKNDNYYYGERTLRFSRPITADEAGVASDILELHDIDEEVARLEKLLKQWRIKLSEAATVEERLRCELITDQVRTFEGGMAALSSLESHALSKELGELLAISDSKKPSK